MKNLAGRCIKKRKKPVKVGHLTKQCKRDLVHRALSTNSAKKNALGHIHTQDARYVVRPRRANYIIERWTWNERKDGHGMKEKASRQIMQGLKELMPAKLFMARIKKKHFGIVFVSYQHLYRSIYTKVLDLNIISIYIMCWI